PRLVRWSKPQYRAFPQARAGRRAARPTRRLRRQARRAQRARQGGTVTDTTWLDATAQAELVRTKQATPLELRDAAVERVERVNPQLNAVIHPLFESARERAKGELPDGPFRGVPILFKDLFAEVAGDPCHEGSRLLKNAGHRSDHTDALAQRYLDAGFV